MLTRLKQNFLFFASYAAFWLVLSQIDRILFLVRVRDHIEGNFLSNVFDAWRAGLKMDVSLTGYLLALPFLFYIVQLFLIRRPVSAWWLRVYTLLPTCVFAAITVINILLYPSWTEKISKRSVLMGAETPEGVYASIDFGMIAQALVILLVFFAVAHYFYHGVVVRFAKHYPQSIYVNGLIMFLGVFIIFSMIRGGYGRANITPSVAYYSTEGTLNHAAVNTYWALLKDFTKSTATNPYRFMSDDEAASITGDILKISTDTIPDILRVQRPNVVLIILEGVVAQVFEELGGEKGVTPGMGRLMREGINYTHAYAAADRSDKGMIALMSGFPAQGPESIIKHVSKHERLPAITQVYDTLGYSISFYHGGQSEFYNFKSYMYAHGADRVVDNADFGLAAPRVSWGVYDHVVADRMLEELNAEEKPFFSIFYTLVNHEPFELTPNARFPNKTKADSYRTTTFYTDSVVFDLVQKAKKQSWYDNTLFVVVSDHGHFYPQEKYDLHRPERYHIPLFIFGGALKSEYRGVTDAQVVSQLDLASTLAGFVGAGAERFPYSRNMFVPKEHPMAFINSNQTMGVITCDQAISYDVQGRKVSYVQHEDQGGVDSLLRTVQAYYQRVFSDFQGY